MNKDKVKDLFWSFVITALMAVVVFILIMVPSIVGSSTWMLPVIYCVTFLLAWSEIYDCMKGK